MMGPLAPTGVFLSGGAYPPSVQPSLISASSEFTNGFNLFAYVGLNPSNRFDPLGLYDDDIDYLIADFTGHKIATLGFLNEASSFALVASDVAIDIAGGLLGVDLLAAAGNIFSGEGTFTDFVTAAAYAIPVGGATVKALWKAKKWMGRFKKVAKNKKGLSSTFALMPRVVRLALWF